MSTRRNRIVVQTPSRYRYDRGQPERRPREIVMALILIGAAGLATFIALLITSRPYDPMNSTMLAQQSVPAGPMVIQPSPKPSVSPSPTPSNQTANSGQLSETSSANPSPADDTSIQTAVEKAIASDGALSDVSVLVENGKVSLYGSVQSTELKQRAERLARAVKGVNAIENQLVVTSGTP